MSKQYVFSNAPMIKHSRHSFDLSHRLFTSGSLGRLYPCLCQEVQPGDQFKIDQNGVIRTSVPLQAPIFDNISVTFAYFFVPHRLVYDKWENVIAGGIGEPNEWIQEVATKVPTYSGSGQVYEKTILDYLNYAVGSSAGGYSSMPARSVAKVWNDWYRDENTMQSVYIATNAAAEGKQPNNEEWSVNNYNGLCPPVCKVHDYFTSALRSPQKGSAVDIPITLSGVVPVTTENGLHSMNGQLRFTNSPSGSGITGPLGSSSSGNVFQSNGVLGENALSITYSNLVANLQNSDSVLSPTVNDLRYAFAVQKILERAARGGTRYTEYIHSAYGVSSPDARLQRAEFLGGRTTPINIQQVANTTSTDSAKLTAYSLSNNHSHMVKAFSEHGYVLGFFYFRQLHTYQQGTPAQYRRVGRYDFFDPAFNNIGEQPIYTSELYDKHTDAVLPTEIFGYKEAWSEMRYNSNRITGEMRSSATNTYDIYHLGDNYASSPTLSSDFIKETRVYLDRALGITDNTDQFLLDISFKISAYRVLGSNSMPSLIDHN